MILLCTDCWSCTQYLCALSFSILFAPGNRCVWQSTFDILIRERKSEREETVILMSALEFQRTTNYKLMEFRVEDKLKRISTIKPFHFVFHPVEFVNVYFQYFYLSLNFNITMHKKYSRLTFNLFFLFCFAGKCIWTDWEATYGKMPNKWHLENGIFVEWLQIVLVTLLQFRKTGTFQMCDNNLGWYLKQWPWTLEWNVDKWGHIHFSRLPENIRNAIAVRIMLNKKPQTWSLLTPTFASFFKRCWICILLWNALHVFEIAVSLTRVHE